MRRFRDGFGAATPDRRGYRSRSADLVEASGEGTIERRPGQLFAWTFAQVSFSDTVLLNTSAPGAESGSTQK